ncbi:TFIIB-type zinc ribbon-containing protein [Leptospira kanakyensis]|uniref:Transcription factor zinc-finger domain-containing protein n=1 Tax=Leptospira kanakyensis TaxID=2484968 RepID=A0A6N4Q7D0_9LEPT|nr:zf-TFIIB domain-containing protein [Leptospira kanakyensis]MCW7469939.1 zf-TFIIB domain-containing protein [Leptospira kanakyensis]TGK47719.1 hypothetical protein EHQ11_17510 [Leptospira kanakyensis]TGK63279.1 hypothetical protein EHQ16_02120 [Leptospira kanakyensis]TGK66885.1 hypothetical protein EHQ18_17355 [Leptospira kanakyensis]
MEKCQKCNVELNPIKTNYGKLIICNNCFGHYYSENTLELLFNGSTWQSEKDASKVSKSKLECPKCKDRMRLHRFSKNYNSVEIDICSNCKILWLDYNEIEDLKLNSIETRNLITNSKNRISKAEINYILNITKLDAKLKEAKTINKINEEAIKFSKIHHYDSVMNASVFNAFDIVTFFKTIFKKE